MARGCGRRTGTPPGTAAPQDPDMDLARNLKVESVSRLGPSPPLRTGPNQTVAHAVALMRSSGVGCVLVTEGDRLRGIFTERDLLRRVLAPGKPLTVPVGDCMTADPETVQAKDSIATALRKMEQGGYRHLPVISESGGPVGVVSVKQVVHYLVEHFPATVYNLPPDPGAVPQEREGA